MQQDLLIKRKRIIPMRLKVITIIILILTYIFANIHFHKLDDASISINKVFPKEFYGWKSKDIKVDKSVFKFLRPEEILSRIYTDPQTGKTIYLSIVMTDKRANIHDPNVCYRMQNIEMDSEKPINLSSDYLAKQVLGKRGKEPYDIIYWYTDLNKTYDERADFMSQIAISKFFDKPLKAFALVILITPKDGKGDVKLFASQISDFIIKLGK